MTEASIGLLDILTNVVVFREVVPYIPVVDLLRLSSTSKALRLICTQPEAWKYLDLTEVQRAQIDGDASPIDVGGIVWRSERMDESLTEDDFYAGPLRGIAAYVERKSLLKHVQTLVLDGLSTPADLIREIIAEDRYNVKVLSAREAKHLNHTKLQQVLRYAVRPTRPEGTPRLRALYLFGAKDIPGLSLRSQLQDSSPLGVMSSQGAQIGAEWNQRSTYALSAQIPDEESRWYSSTGRAIKRPAFDWPDTLQACRGLVCFDAVLCRGIRHDITKVESKDFLQPAIATVALGPGGCEICKSCPESPAVFDEAKVWELPLLGPAPTHSISLRAALRPTRKLDTKKYPPLILRCEDCLRGRWCEQCNRWWCESCYSEPISRLHADALERPMQFAEAQHPNGSSITRTASQHDRTNRTQSVKVFSKLCVEQCLVREMMSGAGSNGMWG